jgi:hypothetical protein
MSDTGLYLNWKPHADDNEEGDDEAADDDDELDPEMQENGFWDSMADPATFAGKILPLFVCVYGGTYIGG